MSSPNPDVTAYIENLEQPKREICLQLRALVTAIPALEEKWSWSRPVYYKDGKPFCYIVSNKKDVNFGFERGASLEDPLGLLKGTGANMRHIKLKKPADLDPASLQALLDQALAL